MYEKIFWCFFYPSKALFMELYLKKSINSWKCFNKLGRYTQKVQKGLENMFEYTSLFKKFLEATLCKIIFVLVWRSY